MGWDDDHRNYNHSDHTASDDGDSNGSAGTTSPQDSHEGEDGHGDWDPAPLHASIAHEVYRYVERCQNGPRRYHLDVIFHTQINILRQTLTAFATRLQEAGVDRAALEETVRHVLAVASDHPVPENLR
jgi:hypothetical protein